MDTKETSLLRTAILSLVATFLLLVGFLYVGSTMSRDDLSANLEWAKQGN